MFGSGGGGLYPIGAEWGTKQADAHEVLILAIEAYCPKCRGRVVEELRGSGDY